MSTVYTIIVNHANITHEITVANTATLIQALRSTVAEHMPNVEVVATTSFEELQRVITSRSDSTIIFSNCPPDSTYGVDKPPSVKPMYGGLVVTTVADSYEKSRLAIGSICRDHPTTQLVIVTGAPEHMLSSHELIELGNPRQIRVKRKRDLFESREDFDLAYVRYILHETHGWIETLSHRTPEASVRIDEVSEFAYRFGAVRVLLLARSGDNAARLIQLIDRVYDGSVSPFSFVTATTLEEAHSILTQYPVEIILTMPDGNYWQPLISEYSRELSPLGAIAITIDAESQATLPPAVTRFPVRSGVSFDITRLTHVICELLREDKNRGARINIISKLQAEFISILEADEDTDLHALRWLTVHHDEFAAALTNDPGLKCFLPVKDIDEMNALVRRVVFTADRTVFTFLPVVNMETSKSREGSLVALLQLWDLPRAPLGTVGDPRLRDFVLEHRELFLSGRLLFYPSPCMVAVTPENVAAVMPRAQTIVSERPDLPIYQATNGYLSRVSANTFDALHTVQTKYKTIAEIGTALAQLRIPYVEHIAPNDLARVLDDSAESLTAFRTRVQKAIQELIDAGSDIESERICRLFLREIQDGERELATRLRWLRCSVALNTVGATFMTALATVSAVLPSHVSPTLAALIGSGGLGAMALQYLTHIQESQTIRNSPYRIILKMAQLTPADTSHGADLDNRILWNIQAPEAVPSGSDASSDSPPAPADVAREAPDHPIPRPQSPQDAHDASEQVTSDREQRSQLPQPPEPCLPEPTAVPSGSDASSDSPPAPADVAREAPDHPIPRPQSPQDAHDASEQITLQSAARLMQIHVTRLYNLDKTHRPLPITPRKGSRAATYRYSELRSWLCSQLPDHCHKLPESYLDAAKRALTGNRGTSSDQ